jgi:L-iditol 2-dehydrogenase
VKAVVFHGPKDYRVEDIPQPEIESGEILVRVRACGICITDLFKGEFGGAKPGAVFGHEISGEVVQVGDGVSNLAVGDRVGVLHHAPDGSCHYCLRGNETLCALYGKTKVYPGGLAEYIRVVPQLVQKVVIKMADHLTFEDGTMIEPTACAYRAITKCGVIPGDTVLVIGDGPLGLMNAQVARALGATQTVVSGHHDYRINLTKKLGTDHAFNAKSTDINESIMELTNGRGADHVIVAVASSEAVKEATQFVRKGGNVCVFGDFRDVPQPNLDIDPKRILRDDVALFGSWGCGPDDYHAAYQLIEAGRVNVKDMVSHVYPIDEFAKATETIYDRQCMRVVIQI